MTMLTRTAASDCSVVICAYTTERWPLLVAAIESVRSQITCPLEIIVVADHSPRLAELLAESYRGSQTVRVVANHEERGLSGARNSGVAAARGSIIAFLDDDATAAPDWLLYHAAQYQNPAVMAVGGAIQPLWQSGRPAWFPEEFDWVVGCTYRGMPDQAAPIRNPIGANMSIRREVLDSNGGFRSDVGRLARWPGGCEETELCIRARQRWPDKLCMYEPRALVYHHVPAQRGSWRYFFARCWAEGNSKATVSRLAGRQAGLASERTYTLRTLPRAVVRNMRESLQRRNRSGFERAGAVATGLWVTTAGYVYGALRGPARGQANGERPALMPNPAVEPFADSQAEKAG